MRSAAVLWPRQSEQSVRAMVSVSYYVSFNLKFKAACAGQRSYDSSSEEIGTSGRARRV